MEGFPACKLGACKGRLQFDAVQIDVLSHFGNDKCSQQRMRVLSPSTHSDRFAYLEGVVEPTECIWVASPLESLLVRVL
jgi:hypothetical protein